jgi:hypothetical protein
MKHNQIYSNGIITNHKPFQSQNWKKQLRTIKAEQGYPILEVMYEEDKELLENFISAEIIEKIAQDVEGWHIKKGGYTELAHQLRDKWL